VLGALLLVGLASMPAYLGAGLIILAPGPVAAIGYAAVLVVATPVSQIVLMLLYRDLARVEPPTVAPAAEAVPWEAPAGTEDEGGPDAPPPPVVPLDLPAPLRGPVLRPKVGFGLVLGVGLVVLVGGVIAFGQYASNIGATVASRGQILSGHTRGTGTPPCIPADLDTTYASDEEIWLGGFFSTPIAPGKTASIVLSRDGTELFNEPAISASGPVPVQCYYELDAIKGAAPGSYAIEVVLDGRRIATGAFTVTP
jgi:hypothetical protein